MSEWVTVGAKVAVYKNSAARGSKVDFRTVARITPTQIVLDDGSRFNRRTLRLMGSVGGTRQSLGTGRSELRPLDDPQVRNERARGAIATLHQRVNLLCRDFDGDADEAKALIAEIRNMIERAENSVHVLVEVRR